MVNKHYSAVYLKNFKHAVFSLLISLCSSDQTSQSYKSDSIANIFYILSIETVFEENLISKHCSELPIFVKIHLFFEVCPFSRCHKSYINSHVFLNLRIKIILIFKTE
jgi:hypothetical protein